MGGPPLRIFVLRISPTCFNTQPGHARGYVCLGFVLSLFTTRPGGAHVYVRRGPLAIGMYASLMAFSLLLLVIPRPLRCLYAASVGDSLWAILAQGESLTEHPFGGHAPIISKTWTYISMD